MRHVKSDVSKSIIKNMIRMGLGSDQNKYVSSRLEKHLIPLERVVGKKWKTWEMGE